MVTLVRAAWQEELRTPKFVGLSTDGFPPKEDPAMTNGARCYYMDTAKEYEYSSSDDKWYEVMESGGGGDITVEPLSVTENGIYTAPSGKAYSPVEVNVSGGGSETVEHGVRFIDYDGSIVTAWDSSEVATKAALPDNPTHDRLVSQGWNWDLQHIKDYVANYPNALVTVGQMYKTASGLTEIDIIVTKVTGKTVTCNMSGNKDWGDGTPQDTATSHTYVDYGNYTITCDGTSIPSGSASNGGMFGSTSSNINRYWCTAMYIGEKVTSIGDYAFYNCYSLTSITIPQGVTSISNNAFYNCRILTSIIIPQGVTSIGENVFYNCYSLTSVIIPQGVTSIGNSAFSNCYSLANVTIPQGVTSIGNYAFQNCYTFTAYDFSSATSIPNLSSTNAFSNINGTCKIIVPATLYDEWIVATNWVTYANYIYPV